MKKFFLLSFMLLFCSVSLYAISLDRLIKESLKESIFVKKSKAEVELSSAQRKENRAGQYGSVNLVGSYTHFNLPRTLAPLTPASILSNPAAVPTTKDLFTSGLSYSVALFTGFAQTRTVEMDEIAQKMAKSKLSLTKEQLAYNIASLYLSILALKEMHIAQIQHVEALTKLTDIIQEEVKLGKKAQIDLLKSQKELYANIAYQKTLQTNIITTKAALASLSGKESLGKLEPLNINVIKPDESLEDILSHINSLQKVYITQLGVRKASKGVKKSNASYYPQVALDAYYGFNYGNNDSSNQYAGEFNSQETWQVALNAKWALFDFGKRDAATQKAQINKMNAALDERQTVLDLRKSLTEANEKIQESYINYKSMQKQYDLAQKSETIEQVRYENSAATINELLYAISQTQLAKSKLIESEYNYAKGKFYMDYLLERGVK
ncbi:TolC family protein [Sulfurimonas sp.]